VIVPRQYRFALLTAVIIHLMAFVTLIFAGWVKEKRSLRGPRDGALVKVSILSPQPKPPKQASKPKPTPKAKPKVTPKRTKKATPQATKKATPKPTQQKTIKKTPKPTPKATPIPKRKTVKSPVSRKKPAKTPEAKEKALSPKESKRLYVNKDRPLIDTSNPKPSTNNLTSNDKVERGSTSLRGAGLPEYYAKAALDKLAKFFRVPPDKQQEITSVISCRIDKKGTITNVRVSRSCGIDELNQIAMAALKNTRRFNPFPDDFDRNYIDIEISFTFKQ
jgi:TonB family protein